MKEFGEIIRHNLEDRVQNNCQKRIIFDVKTEMLRDTIWVYEL